VVKKVVKYGCQPIISQNKIGLVSSNYDLFL